ncbi:MAG: MBL fold metallo-hydrolase, partial [bacterium]
MKITYRHFQNEGIIALDTQMMRPLMVSSHLILQNGKAAFVDVGASPLIPNLLKGLSEHSLSKEDVEYVIVTHVHLDHAGGVGVLMNQLPNAKLVVHPRGSRHMIDPSKLIAGATAVYGPAEMSKTYGEILPVSKDRVIVAEDGFQLDFDGRILEFWDTPGHARHHFCIIDHLTRSIFTGDSFGLSYREFDYNDQVFILPTTSPVQFDPDEMKATIRRIANFQPEAVYLTHFSRLDYRESLAEDLLSMVDAHVEIGQRAAKLEKTV